MQIAHGSTCNDALALPSARSQFRATVEVSRLAKNDQDAYLRHMFEFCLPTSAKVVPDGPEWCHEIKYDGFRLRVHRTGKRVRLFTRGGYDWTKRYPWIVEDAMKVRRDRFVLDGEAVVLGVDGISDFEALYSRQCDDQAQLYAFDVLAVDGEDLRDLPLSIRKTNLARLLARRPDHLRCAFRDWRDWSLPIPRRLQHGARRHGFEASRSALSRRSVPALGEGQEPCIAGNEAGGGGRLVELRLKAETTRQ